MGYWYGNGSTVFNYQCTIGSKNISLTANVNRTKGFTADRNPANFGIQVLHNGVYQRDIYYARRTHKEIPEVFIFPFPVTHYYGGAWFTLGINPRKHFIHVYNYSNGYREYKLSYGGNPCTYAYIDDYDRICGNYNRGENCIVLSGWGICLINGPYGDSSDFGELGYYPKSYQMSVFPR